MPTPAERFEVPPEYAEVYERAYRRAYEEGQLAGAQTEQRSDPARFPAQRSTGKPAHAGPPVVTKPLTRNAGHRGAVRSGSRLSLVLGVICLALLLVLGAVALVRLFLG